MKPVNKQSVRSTISQMAKDGLLIRTRRGHYKITDKGMNYHLDCVASDCCKVSTETIKP